MAMMTEILNVVIIITMMSRIIGNGIISTGIGDIKADIVEDGLIVRRLYQENGLRRKQHPHHGGSLRCKNKEREMSAVWNSCAGSGSWWWLLSCSSLHFSGACSRSRRA